MCYRLSKLSLKICLPYVNTLLLHAVKPNCLLQHEYEEQNYFISPCALPVDTCNDQCTDSRTGTFDTRSGRGSFRALIALMDSLMGLPKTDIHSVMILRHGKVIAEIYPEPFARNIGIPYILAPRPSLVPL